MFVLFVLFFGVLIVVVLFVIDVDIVYGYKMGMVLIYDVFSFMIFNGVGVFFMVSGGWVLCWFDLVMVLK